MRTISLFFLFCLLCFNQLNAAQVDEDFNIWLGNFKSKALKLGIAKGTVEKVFFDTKYLPKVIEYDRYQPEFYEDTRTYVSKRTSNKKVKKGLEIYKLNKKLIDEIDIKFDVEKELLLALMGIETNYGTYLGKMDIISSLATLSFDKRRSEFFTNELITILRLIDNDVIDYKILYGSWAGAFGNFQFMPTTIKNYAIDYDGNNLIELKSANDSFASAANYINKIGWKKNEPCFMKINLNKDIPNKFLNTSAKKLKNKRKLSYFKKYIENYDNLNLNKNLKVAIITPDKEIVENADKLNPAYIVFDNYELVLKWNRSLRFALAVCTLKDNFSNAL